MLAMTMAVFSALLISKEACRSLIAVLQPVDHQPLKRRLGSALPAHLVALGSARWDP